MKIRLCRLACSVLFCVVAAVPAGRGADAVFPVVVSSNVVVRVMAANLNDNSQTYQPFALRILQGLKPDVVAIQEFNYLGNSPGEFRAMVNTTFGTNFSYHRETGAGYSIPNGIISRWPVLDSGSWEDVDTGVNNRGFAWALLDLPGSNDLYVVSVHLKASSGGTNVFRRGAEAAQLKGLMQSNFPANAWVIVAGDCNIFSSAEPAYATLTSYLRDTPVPTDAVSGGRAETNNGRSERYDYVFASPSFNTNHVATTIGSSNFPNGLVFDSRVYGDLRNVAPVQSADSGLAQHMAVVKDFRIAFSVTNLVAVPAPALELTGLNLLRWSGPAGLQYTVEQSETLASWSRAGAAFSAGTNYSFTNTASASNQLFLRVTYP